MTVFYVGSSLLAPLKQAESEINRQHGLDLRVAPYNFGPPFNDQEWRAIESDLSEADVVFVIHVMDGENASRLLPLLDRFSKRHQAVVVINCMPQLMKRTRMGKLDFARLPGVSRKGAKTQRQEVQSSRGKESEREQDEATSLLASVGSWIRRQARGNQAGNQRNGNDHGRGQYLKYVDRLPALLRYVPGV